MIGLVSSKKLDTKISKNLPTKRINGIYTQSFRSHHSTKLFFNTFKKNSKKSGKRKVIQQVK